MYQNIETYSIIPVSVTLYERMYPLRKCDSFSDTNTHKPKQATFKELKSYSMPKNIVNILSTD